MRSGGRDKPRKKRKEKHKERKKQGGKTQPMAKTCPVKQRAGQLFSRIESEKMFVNLPPLVRGVG